jgi:hypothetical protein
VLHANVSGHLALKRLDFGTKDEILRVEDTCDGGIDFRLDLPVLRTEIEKGKLQGETSPTKFENRKV